MLLELEEITKSFEGQPVLRGVSLRVAKGDIVVLLGPSGCGKTTLLRIIAGLEKADGGKLLFKDQDLSNIPVHERGFGMVFQDFALFPHKNVAENISFGLRMRGWLKPQQDERVDQVLEVVGLAGFGERRVYELSGGEQQRVALARSLAPSPQLLLLDEPLGSLDRALRERLMGELRTILKSVNPELRSSGDSISIGAGDDDNGQAAAGMTSIYVTHDQEEAMAIADRILVMNAGKIEQEATPMALYRRPANSFVARFLGMENILPAEVLSLDPPMVTTPIGEFRVRELPDKLLGKMMLLIRPEAGQLLSTASESENVIEGRLMDVSFRGRHQIAAIAVPHPKGEQMLKLAFDSTVILPTDRSKLWIKVRSSDLLILEK